MNYNVGGSPSGGAAPLSHTPCHAMMHGAATGGSLK